MAEKGKPGSASDGGVISRKPTPPIVKGKAGSSGGPIAKRPSPPSAPEPPPAKAQGKQNQSFFGPSYKKGGRVKKTGAALVHKGEHVVSAKHKASRRKRVAGK